jgi:hypothetical protein
MANILSAVAPVAYSAAQVVSAEPIGAVDKIRRDFDSKGVAFGDAIKVPYAPIAAASDFTEAMTPSAGTDKTAATVSVTIDKRRKTSWNLTGEQVRSLENGGNYQEWVRQLLQQGMRTLRNEMEVDCVNAIKQGASRALGSAATTPFASDINDIAALRKLLRDNGAPMADMNLVVDSAAYLNLLKLGIIQQAYQAGTDAERRSGNVMRQFGFAIAESAGIGLHTKGTGASYVTGATGPYVARTTDIPLVTGTGTIIPGDVVTFAADTVNKYVVNSGITAPGTISLGRPGLRASIANGNALTVGNNYTSNVAFEGSAVVGVVRAPIIPANPTINQLVISDDFGMTYLLLDIAGYGMRTWELHAAWGFKVVQPEHVALLLG